MRATAFIRLSCRHSVSIHRCRYRNCDHHRRSLTKRKEKIFSKREGVVYPRPLFWVCVAIVSEYVNPYISQRSLYLHALYLLVLSNSLCHSTFPFVLFRYLVQCIMSSKSSAASLQEAAARRSRTSKSLPTWAIGAIAAVAIGLLLIVRYGLRAVGLLLWFDCHAPPSLASFHLNSYIDD